MQTNTLQDLHIQASRLAQLLTFGEVCSLLRKSRSGVYKLMAADPNFPRPIKDGEARSARAFFVASEIAAYQEAKLAGRSVA
ncbi:MAG: helix-turn-helix transcriptional regulator [Pseudomonas sp.]